MADGSSCKHDLKIFVEIRLEYFEVLPGFLAQTVDPDDCVLMRMIAFRPHCYDLGLCLALLHCAELRYLKLIFAHMDFCELNIYI